MKHLLKICAIAAMSVAASPAVANDCAGPTIHHTVQIKKNGFFPPMLFLCPGDQVFFQNKSGYWATFKQSSGQNNIPRFNSNWVSNGSTVGPMISQQGMGMKMRELDLWNVNNYTYDLEMVFGAAPDHY